MSKTHDQTRLIEWVLLTRPRRRAVLAHGLTAIHDQKCFTILQVAADWHQLMILPQSATLAFHPVACKVLLIRGAPIIDRIGQFADNRYRPFDNRHWPIIGRLFVLVSKTTKNAFNCSSH